MNLINVTPLFYYILIATCTVSLVYLLFYWHAKQSERRHLIRCMEQIWGVLYRDPGKSDVDLANTIYWLYLIDTNYIIGVEELPDDLEYRHICTSSNYEVREWFI